MKYLIELVADASGVETGIDALEQIEKVDKKNAEQFKKSNAEVKKYTSSLDGVSKGVKEITKAATGAFGMEAIKGADKAAQSFRSQLRQSREEITKIFVEGKATTSEIYNAARAGGSLKDKIGDASQAISVLASDTFKLDSAIQGLQVGVSIFQGFSGAAALFGGENQKVMETIRKLNALMAISQSLQQITNALQAQSAFRLGVTVAAQKLYTFAVGESTGALRIFKLALASTGIGLLVIALGTLITNFKDVAKFIGLSSERLDKLKDVFKGTKDAIVSFFSSTGKVISDVFKGDFSQAYEDAKSIGKNVGEAFNKGIEEAKSTRALMKYAEGVDFFQRVAETTGQQLAALQLQFEKAKADLKLSRGKELKERQDATIEFLKADKAIKDYYAEKEKERLAGLDKKYKESIELRRKQLEDEIAILETRKIENKNNSLALLNIEVKLVEKKAELAKVDEKSQAKRALIDAQTIQAISDLHEKYYKAELVRIEKNLKSFQSSEKIKRDEISETNKQLLAELELRNKLNAENLAKLKEDLANRNRSKQEDFDATLKFESDKNETIKNTAIQGAKEISSFIFDINNQRRQQELAADIAALNERKNAELANKNLTEEQKARINARYAAQELQLKKQAFEQEKRLKIGQALINGALAVTTILSTIPPVIQAGPVSVPNPAYYSSLALTALTTALSVSTIARSKYAKGTEFVNGGGTETSDSVPAMLSRGERVIDAQTNKALKGIPNKMLPLLVNQSYLPSPTVISKGMDYDLLAKTFAAEIRKQPLLNMNFDKNGFETYFITGNTRTHIKNNKNEF